MSLLNRMSEADKEVLRDYQKQELDRRLDVWHAAAQAVKPIVEAAPLVKHSTGAAFTTTAVYSPAEQHVDLIIRVADWLLESDTQEP